MVSGISSSDGTQTQFTLTGTVGGSVLFPVPIPEDREVMSIFWNSDKTVIAIVKPNNLDVKNDRFQGRIQVQKPGYSLNMSHLGKEDVGTYEAQIFTDSTPIHIIYILQVTEISSTASSIWMDIRMVTTLGILVSFIVG
ncbi:SLAM family member 9-like isoform X2 [Ascaphus truei]|uniref:SLAM family member 9-like isoform X2 n=1 Tax=Ascaphus truei TaxID=8439 RepID=UPI003F5A893F